MNKIKIEWKKNENGNKRGRKRMNEERKKMKKIN
jgi:hypothetical protein